MTFDIERYFPDELHARGDAGRASFEEKRPLYLAGSKRYLAHYRDEIKARHDGGERGDRVVELLTEMTDLMVVKLFTCILTDLTGDQQTQDRLALVAVGGYGRGELNPYSDIDLMFLYEGKNSQCIEDVAQKLLYFLWDMRLDVGYSVRTIADCVEMGQSDLTVRTALLDSRLLMGNRQLFDEFQKVKLTQLLSKGSDAFIRAKVEELRHRREKYGSTVYMLEPNVKESEGALRDLHTAMWVAKIKYKIDQPRELVIKGVLTEEELGQYGDALEYLWRIRNQMHFGFGRKCDQLTFEAQTSLAAYLGYKDSGRTLAVEEFMRDYYLHAVRVEHFASHLINACAVREESALKILGYFIRRQVGEGFYVTRGELHVPDQSVLEADPSRLMKLFEYAQKQGVVPSVATKTLVRKNLHLVNDKFRRSREVNQSFFNILRSAKAVSETLQVMHHLGFLNRFIPEFEHIYCKVQHDMYHVFTVDMHSLFAVNEVVRLWQGELAGEMPLLTRIAGEVGKRELLLLAVLFHDIGKGEGGGHSEKGADMCRTIARRMGLHKEDSERLEFLVRNHLLFAHIAQRRDLHDEKMIIQFARQMGTSETLRMLYLLTYADVRSVGPDVWNDWKAMLFEELYSKTLKVLERGDFKLEASSERVKKARKQVVEILEADFPATRIKEELKALTTRHVLSNPPAEIAGHLRYLIALEDHDVHMSVSHEQERGYSSFTICTYDLPGLFSKITGVMAANGMNILGAQINTSTNGKVLDILQLNSPQGFIVTDDSRWKRVQEDMRQVLEGKVQVKALVEKRHRPSLLAERVKPRFPTRVEIDNEVSEDYTVIDIYTHDKVGVLYSITSTLTELGLYIGVAKISTKVDQVADVFYVKDIFGHKVTADDKLEELRTRLREAIDA